MYIYRNVPAEVIIRFGWKNILFFLLYGGLLCVAHHYLLVQHGFAMHIPFSLIGPVGVAVAIYAGFKNSQSYDRTWEARKNWGALTGQSKVFANQVCLFVGLEHRDLVRQLIDRQLAYLQAHKLQLRARMPHSRKFTGLLKKYYGGVPTEADWQREVTSKLSAEDYAQIQPCANRALQLMYLQNQALGRLKESGLINEFQLMSMMDTLHACMENQGKNERIKTTPFPRQYAYFARTFVIIYILLLPFGILDIYKNHSPLVYVMVTLISSLISWLFITMELIGDHSEDPFEHFITDIPMNALCRNLEIDLYQLLKAESIPAKIEAKQGILM